MQHHSDLRSDRGLTLIEILIALTLMGVLVSFVVSSLAGSFQITRQNRLSLDATTTAQRVIEEIRGQWSSRAVYNTNCATVTLNSVNASYLTLSATSATLNATASTAGTTTAVTTPCGTFSASTICTSAMRRVVVIALDSSDTSRTLARVTLDVACPVNP